MAARMAGVVLWVAAVTGGDRFCGFFVRGVFRPNGQYRVPGGTARPAHPLGVLLGLSRPYLGRRPRRAVPSCCRANSSFRVPSGPTGAFAGVFSALVGARPGVQF